LARKSEKLFIDFRTFLYIIRNIISTFKNWHGFIGMFDRISAGQHDAV